MNPNTLRKIQRLLNGESFITSEPGNSMLPLYKSNEKHLVTPIKWEDCKVGDVVFSKNKTGTVVALEENQRCHTLGHYSEEWNMDCFEKFKGEIKLSN